MSLISIHSAIFCSNWKYNIVSWKSRSRRVWRTKWGIDFDAIILLTARAVNKQERNCILCLKKATAHLVHRYWRICCFGRLEPFTCLFQKPSSKYYSGQEIKILLPYESLSLTSSVYDWYNQNLHSILCRIKERDFPHNWVGPGKWSCLSPVIQGPLPAKKILKTHSNYVYATLKANQNEKSRTG